MTKKKSKTSPADGPTVFMEPLCKHGKHVHGVRDFMAERNEGHLVRVGPRTYCGEDVGLCEAYTTARELGTKTRVTCPGCLDALRIILGDNAEEVLGVKINKRKRRAPVRRPSPRKKRRKKR